MERSTISASFNNPNVSATFGYLLARACCLLVCLVFAACSQGTDRAGGADGNSVSPAPAETTVSSPSPTDAVSPTAASDAVPPLKTPERVASGEVTESGGGWNKAVQNFTYTSSADNTRQPMMFYKPPPDSPRPLLVGLHPE